MREGFNKLFKHTIKKIVKVMKTFKGFIEMCYHSEEYWEIQDNDLNILVLNSLLCIVNHNHYHSNINEIR